MARERRAGRADEHAIQGGWFQPGRNRIVGLPPEGLGLDGGFFNKLLRY